MQWGRGTVQPDLLGETPLLHGLLGNTRGCTVNEISVPLEDSSDAVVLIESAALGAVDPGGRIPESRVHVTPKQKSAAQPIVSVTNEGLQKLTLRWQELRNTASILTRRGNAVPRAVGLLLVGGEHGRAVLRKCQGRGGERGVTPGRLGHSAPSVPGCGSGAWRRPARSMGACAQPRRPVRLRSHGCPTSGVQYVSPPPVASGIVPAGLVRRRKRHSLV